MVKTIAAELTRVKKHGHFRKKLKNIKTERKLDTVRNKTKIDNQIKYYEVELLLGNLVKNQLTKN